MAAVADSPDHPALDSLCARLRKLAPTLAPSLAPSVGGAGNWPAEQLRLCAEAGVFEWFLPLEHGGRGWSDADIVRGYLRLSAACLTTTFIITQLTGACRRLAASDNEDAHCLLPDLMSGRSFATLGISHLTTSRRHLAKPVLRASETSDAIVLDGFSPWCTGAAAAQTIITGATLDDERQVVLALSTNLPGVSIEPSADLIALSASQTGPVKCDKVAVPRKWLLAGPVHDVMQQGVGARTGGLQTSTLAVGLAAAAIEFLSGESEKRPDLHEPAAALQEEWTRVRDSLLSAAKGETSCSKEQLRIEANSLVLRATQAALAGAKGAGYVVGHPAGRWCGEALFFLVWSCPQAVVAANLCEFAGVGD